MLQKLIKSQDIPLCYCVQLQETIVIVLDPILHRYNRCVILLLNASLFYFLFLVILSPCPSHPTHAKKSSSNCC